MKVVVALAFLALFAMPMCIAEENEYEIETEIVGEGVVGRALMRKLMQSTSSANASSGANAAASGQDSSSSASSSSDASASSSSQPQPNPTPGPKPPGPNPNPGPKPPGPNPPQPKGPKGKGPPKKQPPPYEPKYKQKTCYATSTYEKEDECKTVIKKVKFYKKKTYVSSYPVTHTHTYVSTVTFPPVYKTYPVYYYKKKGWGDNYYLPKECEHNDWEQPQPEPKW